MTQELALGVDESYNLTIQAPRATLEAATAFGAMRGLETFSQVLMRGRDQGFVADVQRVEDKPRYGFRGLMVDTARHFLPVPMLLAVLDGMAYEKLNVLHWHAVDDQSFPLEVLTLPKLAKQAAFTPTHIYSRSDISRVVAYGRERGIRVVLEVDTPGHCRVLERAYPELGLITACAGTTPWPPLDISKNSTLDFVRKIWHDLIPLFPDISAFIGGDECHTECWGANAHVTAWAKEQGLTTSGGGEGSAFAWWINQMVSILHDELGKTPMMWSPLDWDPSSPPTGILRSKAVLNLWTGNLQQLAYNITVTGANKLVTSVNWYLPVGVDNAYKHDPVENCDGAAPFRCNAAQREAIIGGEACMWGENVDVSNFFGSVWPDLTAVAERLWSPKDGGPGGLDLLDGERRRLRIQRCRLLARGLPVKMPGSMIYYPDASHASFELWREWQWCAGDANFAYTPTGPTHAGHVDLV